jgi:transcriptional regulator with XRE-family HTH domain
MRLSPDCYKFKEEFGKYLRSEREFSGLSSYRDLSYVLGLSEASAGHWERGWVFPRSTIVLKKINLLFNNTPDVINELFTRDGIKPTQKELDTFRKTAEENKNHTSIIPLTKLNKETTIVYSDSRENECRKAFGKYLTEKRLRMGISAVSLCKALGKKSVVAVHFWENGTSFPSDVKDLILLDKLFGDTIKVMFGLCEKYGVKLLKLEKQEVLSRLEEVRKF